MKRSRTRGGEAPALFGRTFPRPIGWSVACDFDGTFALDDVVNTVLDRFAEPAWLQVEAEWRSGLIGSRECLERQTRLLRVAPDALAAYVDQVRVDPDGAAFLADCRALGHDVRIVSDGWDWVIVRVLRRVGVLDVPIVANRLTHVGDDRWRTDFPYAAAGCASGVCKCLASPGVSRRVHVGDGRSDACAADAADLVFAKGWLHDSRVRRGRASLPFQGLAQVRSAFVDALAAADASTTPTSSKVAADV